MAKFQHNKPTCTQQSKPCLLCGIFGARSSSGTMVTPQRCDMSLLWIPGGYVALASAVWHYGIVECGAIPTSVPLRKLRLYWISLEPRARHTCENVPERNLLYIAQAPIFFLHLILLLTLPSTRILYRSRARAPSNFGVTISADVTHDEYERHRACPSVRTSTDQSSHVPLHVRTSKGAALSSWGTSHSSLVRASRGQGF